MNENVMEPKVPVTETKVESAEKEAPLVTALKNQTEKTSKVESNEKSVEAMRKYLADVEKQARAKRSIAAAFGRGLKAYFGIDQTIRLGEFFADMDRKVGGWVNKTDITLSKLKELMAEAEKDDYMGSLGVSKSDTTKVLYRPAEKINRSAKERGFSDTAH